MEVWSIVHCTSHARVPFHGMVHVTLSTCITHARGHLHGMVHGTLFIPCYGSWYIVHVHPICIMLESYTVHLCIVSMLTLYRLWSHVHSMFYYQLPVISLSIVCYCMIHVTVEGAACQHYHRCVCVCVCDSMHVFTHVRDVC